MMNFKEKLIKIIFIFSLPFLSLILCGNYELSYIKYVILLSFLCGIFISLKILKEDILNNINYRYLLFAVLGGLYSESLFSQYSSVGVSYIFNIFNDLLGISLSFNNVKSLVSFMAIPSFVILLYYIIINVFPLIKKEMLSLNKIEKNFILGVLGIGAIATIFIYTATNAFYNPVLNDKVIYYDVIYTADSGSLYQGNAYLNIGMEENDIRQPLFGFFAAPVAIISYFIAEFLFFIPNSQVVIFNSLQILLITLSIVMLSRLLRLEGKRQLMFMLLCTSCYSVILYCFLLEQYVISFFYLILALYISDKDKLKVNYFYIGAVGTLLTSGIIFPIISKFKNIKYWFTNILKCFVFFVILMILSGQFLQFFNFIDKLKNLMRFSGKELLFMDKFNQFLYFVRSMFIAPKGIELISDGVLSYRMINVDFISFSGIIILIICAISTILNKKNKMAIVSFGWVIFSFLILCILGWGTQENGLILYSLYFCWAYVILIYLFIDKIIKSKKIKFVVYGILCLILLIFNIYELGNIISFGIRYY